MNLSLLYVFEWICAITPGKVEKLSLIPLVFIVADTFTGVAVAAMRGRLSSRLLWQKALLKTSAYTAFLLVGFTVSAITQQEIHLMAALGLITGAEIVSLGENVIAMRAWGLYFGPANAWLEKIGGLFPTPDSPSSKDPQAESPDPANVPPESPDPANVPQAPPTPPTSTGGPTP